MSVTPLARVFAAMRAVFEVAAGQQGLFTTAQATAVGISSRRLWARAAKGEIVQAHRSVWKVAGVPSSFEQVVLAALLAAGEPAWASHRTGARVWDLRVPPPARIDVLTLPSRRLRLEGVAHHTSAAVRLPDVTRHNGIWVTSVARTLVDCTPWLPGDALVKAVDDARRRGLLPDGGLDSARGHLDRGRHTGRHKVVPLRKVATDRDPGGSDRELDVLTVLANAGLPRPMQQFRVNLPGGPRFLDYAYPHVKVGLEWDGFAEHGLIRSTFDDDRDRNAELQLAGWLMLHFTSNTAAARLAQQVDRALHLRAA